MSVVNFTGPVVIDGASATGTNSNPDFGASLTACGDGLMDTRNTYAYGGAGNLVTGYLGFTDIPTIDQVPSAATVTAIAAAQTPTSGTKLALVSTSGTVGITVLSASLQVIPSGNYIPSGSLVIDSAPSTVYISQSRATQLYNPQTALARAVSINCNGNDSGGTYTVTGADVYGYAMHEAITGPASSGTVTGNKAFKFITSIVPTGTINSTSVSVGQADKFGFPIRADNFGQTVLVWNNGWVTSTATGTFAFAVTTSPATYTTGDVRGTWVPSPASNGTIKLQVFNSPSVANVLSQTGLWGVTQA